MDESRRSDDRRPRGRRVVRTLAALFLAFGAGGVLLAASGPGAEIRIAGEHGLAVAHVGDSVVVRWITAEPVAGVLEVHAGETRLAVVETPAGYAHQATVPAGGVDDLTLRYGTRSGEESMHETRVSLRAPARQPAIVTGVDSLYILGDTHGELDALMEGLQAAGLVDSDLRWTGGTRHLVFAGDLTDRGPDVIGLLWLVYRLEREAAAAGGAVHVVLGNHELMVLLGDLRYVHPKELHIAELHGVPYDRLFDVQTSVLGRWLASKPGLLRVDRTLISHGGLGPLYADYGLMEFDDSLRTYASEELFARWADERYLPPIDSAALERRNDFFWHPDTAFWHRAFVQTDTADALLGKVLEQMESDLLVVGHTAVAAIEPRYDDRLIPAHTPRHGAELLLLVRGDSGTERYRITAAGHERF